MFRKLITSARSALLFASIIVGIVLCLPSSEALEEKNNQYTIIVSDEVSSSVVELKTAIKNVFGDIQANEIDYLSPQAKKIITQLGIEFIPYVIFEKTIVEKKRFSDLEKKRMIVKIQNKYVIPEGMLTPMGGVFFKRKKKPNRLDLFVMSKCPAGNDALRRAADLLKKYKQTNIEIVVHYITDFHEFGISSVHGPEEIKENIHQLLIQEKYPEKFWDYQPLYRQIKDFESICKELNISLQEVTDYHHQGISLLEADFKLCQKFGVRASPSFLWENRFLFISQLEFDKFIIKKFGNPVLSKSDSSDIVTIDFFYNPVCSGCHWVLEEHIPYLKEKFFELININYYNVDNRENFEKMSELSKKLGVEDGVIPRVIIGEKVLTGRREIEERLEAIIEENFLVVHQP